MEIKDLKDSFEQVEDFRQLAKVRHALINILFIGVVATIANANSFIEIGEFAELKEGRIKRRKKL